MFFNMESELNSLKEAIASDNAELIVIYGRRRIGKTTLVLRLLEDVKGVYLYTPRGSLEDILYSFSQDIRTQLNEYVAFTDWNDFLNYLIHLGKKGTSVIIDEFQRLEEAYKPSISLLQKVWDLELRKTKIKLVLVGSVIGLVERLVLSGDAPLFGRRTREFKITPLDYFTFREYFNGLDEKSTITYYGIFGGTLGYFTKIDKSSNISENIEALILNEGAPLAREPEQLLAEETRSPATYMSILATIARSGRGVPLSKIHTRRGSPTVYLNNLIKMDIIEKLISLAQGSSIYTIKDEFFRFWFTMIYPRLSLLESRKGKELLKLITSKLDNYLSVTLEKVLRQLIVRAMGKKIKDTKIPIINSIGAFWRKNIELDACAISQNFAITGEAKWIERKIDRREVEKFIAKTQLAVQQLKKEKWIGIILSKKGFTTQARKLESDSLILLDIDELNEIKD